ncbi:low molecular weight protein-tyrosine-phosphatase [Natronospira sp.]|uniref:low molecular weight protein-tyrosine-phosphatase n=1 Tax=Natronospira sp. TaxID=2024970 RepID=UPI003872EB8A
MSKRVLFVCLGNICRSPTAEGIFRHLLEQRGIEAGRVEFDSAGTHGYHVGKGPDPRAAEAAMRRGISLAGIRARQLEPADFQQFDLILCADESNLHNVGEMRPAGARAEVRLLLEYASESPHREVPDPYYGGERGFEQVLDLVEEACEGLLEELLRP